MDDERIRENERALRHMTKEQEQFLKKNFHLTKQELIEFAAGEPEEVGGGVLRVSDGPQDDVSVRMDLCLRGRDELLVEQILNEGVIGRDLTHVPSGERVQPAVANVDEN